MKTIKATYIGALVLGAMALGSCNDNFERPPLMMLEPTSDWKANITIADFKKQYWQSDRNYVATAGTQDGGHMYIAGRVVSQSASGNIYNSIVLQDATGAINIAVVSKNLTKTYNFGQEVIVDVTDLKVGGYNGLMQLGAEGTYNGAPSMTFMAADVFESHAEINRLPDPAKVDTTVTTPAHVQGIKTDTDSLIKYQSRLVRLTGLTFETPGQPWATDKNTDRYAKDADGNRINVRTSSYASFKSAPVPTGTGDVVGILSYYGSDWQVLLNDTTGIIGFDPVEPVDPENPDNPVVGAGTKDNPYTVANLLGGATGSDVWVGGYIVGWIDGKAIADGARFSVPATVNTNLLLADAADVTDVAKCVPVQLPSGAVRATLNLVDHPENLGKKVLMRGNIAAYFGVNGLKEATECEIEGGTTPGPDVPVTPVTTLTADFEGSTALPAGWTQVQVAGNKQWYVTTFSENNYAAMTGYKGTAPFDQWLLTPPVDMAAATVRNLNFRTQFAPYGSTTSVFEVYVLDNADPAKATVKDKLTVALPTSAASTYSDWVNSGTVDLSKYTGTVYIGFRYSATQDANYATWCVDDVKVNVQ